MGEYAKYNGESIKVGTCEDFYYLRDDQRDLVTGYTFDRALLDVARFRFPFPREDGVEPGQFENHMHGVRVPGYSLPAELSGSEHGSVQFTSTAGYVLSIPCPEQFDTPGLGPVDVNGVPVHRNGFNGHPVVRQQAHRGGHLVTILSCNACGAPHRLDTKADAAEVAEAFIEEADRTEYRDGTARAVEYAHSNDTRREYALIAARILRGYDTD